MSPSRCAFAAAVLAAACSSATAAPLASSAASSDLAQLRAGLTQIADMQTEGLLSAEEAEGLKADALRAHQQHAAPAAATPLPGAPMLTFGNGVAGFPLCAEPVVLVNHTLSAGATHGVLHHFWSTGAAIKVDRLWVEYFLDGETTPSISFQPSHMCGLASSFLPLYMQNDKTDLYHAGAMCGRNSAVGGYFNTFPIPFGKSAVVTVRSDPQDCAKGCCGGGYLNVRGTENLPVVLPGSGIPLPNTARLHLQKNEWAVRKPAEHVPVIDVPSGNGLVFMSTLSVEAQPVGGERAGGGYIEGCWQFYNSGATPYPGLVVGTGVEDYFDSSYYFGADAGIFGKTHQIPELMFRNELSGLTFFQREAGYERLSAYRFHANDPLVFNGGGKLLWWVGQCKPFDSASQNEGGGGGNTSQAGSGLADLSGGTTKCGNPVPPTPAGTSLGWEPEVQGGTGRQLTPVNVTTYGWYYSF